MTNPDTSTLNGALEQLGITMADNLVTMGVSDADPSDGLTTLANKILDITPGPGPTPTPASIDLVATNSILSYADGDSTVLTATVLDSSDNPVSGATVELYKAGVLWDTLTTDSSGECTKTYTSAGIGDVSFEAKCNLLTKIFSLEDCLKVWPDTWTQGGSNRQIALNFALPSAFEISYKTKTTSYAQLIVGKTYGTLDYILNQNSSNNMSKMELLKRVNSSSAQSVTSTGSVYPSSATYDIRYQYNNGVHTAFVNDVQAWSVTDTSVEITHLLYWSIRDATTSNLKVKPL